VVPYRQQIVAHGTDAAQVLKEAAEKTGKPAAELALTGIIDPLQELLP
jgi:hypothetical protein